MLRSIIFILFIYFILSQLLIFICLFNYNNNNRVFGGEEDAEYIHICQASDENLPKCIISSIEELRPQLKKGIPELDVPPMEPLPLDKIQLKRGPTSARIDANITDLKVWGPSDFQIKDLKVDLPKKKFWFKVLLPRLHIEGKYDLDMGILFFQLKGHGPITGNFTNYEAQALMTGNIINQNGQEYLKFDKMKMRISLGDAKLYLGNLFSGGSLGAVTNDVINQNTDLFLNEIRPSIENSLSDKFTEIANKITLKFTYKELFP